MSTSQPVVPPCPKCGKPLGLYYMDCLWCYGYADTYSYADYEREYERTKQEEKP